MNGLNSGRGKEAWGIIYSNSSSSLSQAAAEVNKEGPWKSLGSSMNAVSFGFVATAVLISMFLIMAIFEHLFRPSSSSSSPSHRAGAIQSAEMHKLNPTPQPVQETYAADFSVVMPGQRQPTFIAQPAPCLVQGKECSGSLISSPSIHSYFIALVHIMTPPPIMSISCIIDH